MVSVWPQWWQPVSGPRDKIWDLVALVWPIRSRAITTSSALVRCWNSSVAPVLVSQDRDLCHAQLHPTWFEPTSECRSWPVVSYLYSGHLPVGLCLSPGSLLLVGPLFHFRQCHSGLVPSRNAIKGATCDIPGDSKPLSEMTADHLLHCLYLVIVMVYICSDQRSLWRRPNSETPDFEAWMFNCHKPVLKLPLHPL